MLNEVEDMHESIRTLTNAIDIVDFITTDTMERDIGFILKRAQYVTDPNNAYVPYFSTYYGKRIIANTESVLQLTSQNTSKVLDYFEACNATNGTVVIMSDANQLTSIRKESTTQSYDNPTSDQNSVASPTETGETASSVNPNCNESISSKEGSWETVRDFFLNHLKPNVTKKMALLWEDLPPLIKQYLTIEENEYNVSISYIYQKMCNTTDETTTAKVELSTVFTESPKIDPNLPEDIINCSSLFDNVKRTVLEPSYYEYYHYNLQYQLDTKQEYMSMMNAFYVNMTPILESKQQHQKCVAILDPLLATVEQLDSLYGLVEDLEESGSMTEAIPILRDALTSYLKVKPRMSDFADFGRLVNSPTHCEWYERTAAVEQRRLPPFYNSLQTIKDYQSLTNQYMRDSFTTYNSIKYLYTTEIYPTLKFLFKYLDKDIEKMELAESFLSAAFTKEFDTLVNVVESIKSYSKDFKNQATALKTKVIEVLQDLSEFNTPVLNHINILESDFVTAIRLLEYKPYDKILDNLGANLEKGISELLSPNYEKFVHFITTNIHHMTSLQSELNDKVSALTSDLSAYLNSVAMDVNFYMWVSCINLHFLPL